MEHPSTGFPQEYLTPGSSFVDFVRAHAPATLPDAHHLTHDVPHDATPHGTTIVSLEYNGGVILAGDRRATMGSMIAHREIEKVFAADEHSTIGIAGTAGIAIELVRLFQLELEHYEKIEGAQLSLDGKANRLSTMLRSHLTMALRGLAVIPVFAGWDHTRARGRIYSYDVAGGRYEEPSFTSVGSGSVFARGALKKLWRPGMDEHTAVSIAIEALWDAADDDSATAGPDAIRKIWPIIAVVDATGFRYVTEPVVADICALIAAQRVESHRGVRILEPGRDGPGNRLPTPQDLSHPPTGENQP
ncbi:proteasome subunit beta [Jonesia quinghaiensis]|uniref:proteasome subunit beta n=1 Tax=Jonesia quinghaiensis TaxID=262806 RepID=UPI000412A74E|nr:proteasome subunit beta [Jonesia quinghaiensis]